MVQVCDITDQDFLQACSRFGDYFLYNIKTCKYTPFKPVYQKGPTCGLTALGMYCGLNTQEIENSILEEARNLGYTKRGEMFSARNMCSLTERFVDKKVELFSGYLSCDKIIEFLLNGGVLLVPYDADANHEPCIKSGHRAHWALVSGVMVCHSAVNYVLARQGKSKMLGLWPLSLLAASNAQLNVVSPDRNDPVEYVLPKDGLQSDYGLNGKSIMIHHF